jgi:pimeloyl-ACP methyl ester carboxylesterase
METPLFFKSGAEDLFGVLHTPDDESPKAGILLCHAFGEEKLWAHRVSVNLAREAACRGYAAFRFDFPGHGDSTGRTENCDIESYLADIGETITTFRTECPSVKDVGLVGLRFGATLASLYANRDPSIRRLALWEPVTQGKRYMQELLRINLSTQLAVYGNVQRNREALVEQMQAEVPANVDGYLISKDFYEQSNEADLLNLEWENREMDVLVTQIAPTSSQKDKADLLGVVERHPRANFVKVEEPPFWREIKPFVSRTKNLVRETMDWWEEQVGD